MIDIAFRFFGLIGESSSGFTEKNCYIHNKQHLSLPLLAFGVPLEDLTSSFFGALGD